MSAGVPHDTLTDAVEVGKWLGATNAPVAVIDAQERVAAELARVSSEHETMRNALKEARPYVLNVESAPANEGWRQETAAEILGRIDAALAAGSRVEDGERVQYPTGPGEGE